MTERQHPSSQEPPPQTDTTASGPARRKRVYSKTQLRPVEIKYAANLQKVRELLETNNNLTKNDVATATGMSVRSAEKYLARIRAEMGVKAEKVSQTKRYTKTESPKPTAKYQIVQKLWQANPNISGPQVETATKEAGNRIPQRTAARLLTKIKAAAGTKPEQKLTAEQREALDKSIARAIMQNPRRNRKQLALKLGISPGTIPGIEDRLRRDGLIPPETERASKRQKSQEQLKLLGLFRAGETYHSARDHYPTETDKQFAFRVARLRRQFPDENIPRGR